MVQIQLLTHPPVTYRSASYTAGDVIRVSFEGSLPLSQLSLILGLAPGSRLLSRGQQLDLNKSLEEQGCRTKDTLFLLDTLSPDICSEWARIGRCPLGAKCVHAHSHKMEHSPRYVEHRAAEIARNSSSSSSTPEPSPSLHPREGRGVVCKHWAATGSCHYGASCFYADSHVSMCSPCGEESPVSPLEPQEMGATMWEQYTDRSNMHHQSPGLITFGDFIPTSSEWDQPCWHQPNGHQINSHIISAPHVQYMTMQQPAYNDVPQCSMQYANSEQYAYDYYSPALPA